MLPLVLLLTHFSAAGKISLPVLIFFIRERVLGCVNLCVLFKNGKFSAGNTDMAEAKKTRIYITVLVSLSGDFRRAFAYVRSWDESEKDTAGAIFFLFYHARISIL